MNITRIDLNNIGTNLGPKVVECTEYINQLGMFEALLFNFFIFIVAMVVHELGHYTVAKMYGFKPTIYFHNMKLYTKYFSDDDRKKEKEITSWGIIAGYIPIFLAAAVHPFYLLVIPAYFMGTTKDMKEVFSK